jgi:adenosylmethionine-8-amino-7-oxononanoate aminotransferase
MIEGLLHSMIVCPEMDRDYPRITHGKGVYLYDDRGQRYIDVSAGSAAVSNLGYGIDEIAEVIRTQTCKVAVIPTHAFSSEITEQYLKQLVSFAPGGFSRAWTVMSGTEAVENAAKVALQYHQLKGDKGRYKVISRWGSYHGNSIFALDIGGMKFRRQSYAQWLNNFPHISPAYSYRRPNDMTEERYEQQCIDELLECIEENSPSTIAMFIAEPVVGAALGAVPPPPNYFRQVREICDHYGIVFIVDEVMTGFGRLGANFGIERFGVTPDIIAAGKGISGGYYPLSGVIVHEKITSVFEEKRAPFLGGHTFACNPAGAAVGSFVIDYMAREGLVRNAALMGDIFGAALAELERYDIVGNVRGVGLMQGIELVRDKVTREPFPVEIGVSRMIFNEGLKRGVILYPGKGSYDGVLGDHILLTPPLCVRKEEIGEIVAILSGIIAAVEKKLEKVK